MMYNWEEVQRGEVLIKNVNGNATFQKLFRLDGTLAENVRGQRVLAIERLNDNFQNVGTDEDNGYFYDMFLLFINGAVGILSISEQELQAVRSIPSWVQSEGSVHLFFAGEYVPPPIPDIAYMAPEVREVRLRRQSMMIGLFLSFIYVNEKLFERYYPNGRMDTVGVLMISGIHKMDKERRDAIFEYPPIPGEERRIVGTDENGRVFRMQIRNGRVFREQAAGGGVPELREVFIDQIRVSIPAPFYVGPPARDGQRILFPRLDSEYHVPPLFNYQTISEKTTVSNLLPFLQDRHRRTTPNVLAPTDGEDLPEPLSFEKSFPSGVSIRLNVPDAISGTMQYTFFGNDNKPRIKLANRAEKVITKEEYDLIVMAIEQYNKTHEGRPQFINYLGVWIRASLTYMIQTTREGDILIEGVLAPVKT